MKIQPQQFVARFVSCNPQSEVPAQEASVADSVELSSAGLPPQALFSQKVLALAAASPGALAAFAQTIARGLTTSESEEKFAASLNDTFSSRFVPSPEPLEKAWHQIETVTGQHFSPPQLVNSILVYAQADTRNLYIGKSALEGDLADPNVLVFALAHEEGHRQHRDSAGTKGLDALLEACQDSPELFKPALAAVREGHLENERQADAFGARVAARLGCDPSPIVQFLESMPEDPEHPAGTERAAAVSALMRKESNTPIS